MEIIYIALKNEFHDTKTVYGLTIDFYGSGKLSCLFSPMETLLTFKASVRSVESNSGLTYVTTAKAAVPAVTYERYIQ